MTKACVDILNNDIYSAIANFSWLKFTLPVIMNKSNVLLLWWSSLRNYTAATCLKKLLYEEYKKFTYNIICFQALIVQSV